MGGAIRPNNANTNYRVLEGLRLFAGGLIWAGPDNKGFQSDHSIRYANCLAAEDRR